LGAVTPSSGIFANLRSGGKVCVTPWQMILKGMCAQKNIFAL
jgi:hypothetical protein